MEVKLLLFEQPTKKINNSPVNQQAVADIQK